MNTTNPNDSWTFVEKLIFSLLLQSLSDEKKSMILSTLNELEDTEQYPNIRQAVAFYSECLKAQPPAG